MEQVSPISAALLQLEAQAERAQMHVGWLARVDAGAGGAPLDVAALRERVEQRLAGAPRFRHVVARAEERSGQLVWRDDPSFAVERHVAVCDTAVGGDDELREVIDRFLSQQLTREQPLWRVLVVPRTRAGGAAIVGKAHRALSAGEGAAALRDLVFDAGPPGAGGLGAGSAADPLDDAAALGEFRTAHRLGALAAARRDHGGLGATMRRAAYARTEGLLAPAPPSYLNAAASGGVAAGAPRTLVTARLELGRLQRIAARTQTELHDVVLAIAAGALRRVALAAGQEPADLRAMVPVDVGEHALLGEEPCAVVELPVAERNPAARLRAIHATMRVARRPRGDGFGGAPDGTGGRGRADSGGEPDRRRPPTLLAGPPEELATRLAIGARLCNLTIPSARGPERALHVGGAHVRALFPVAPLHEEHALTLSTLSYGRHLHVTAAVDAAAIGGAGRLPVMLADAAEELGLSTGARGSRGLP